MKFTVKLGVSLALSLSLLISQSGCTYALWTDEDVEGYKQPAPTPNLHVYQSKKENDFLVVYQEQSERKAAIHTRAYWLIRNQIRVTNAVAPIFVSKRKDRNLPAVPVFSVITPEVMTNQYFYAVYGTNFGAFTLYSGERQIGSYNLPAYDAKRSTTEKVALTPVTMVADAAIAAAVVAAVGGLIYLSLQASQ